LWSQLAFLIDTGASVTAIKASVFHQIPIHFGLELSPSPIDSLRAVSGAVMPVLGYTRIPFSIANDEYPFYALIIESLTYDVILGRDFLKFYKAKIDLAEHRLLLSYNPSSDGLTHSPEPVVETAVCSVHGQTTFIIPPHS